MNAKIDGKRENEKKKVRIGLRVEDNNAVVHGFELDIEGTVHIHDQDGYPDHPNNRTDQETEWFDQARDYAKWYVAQETEHDTAPWYLDTSQLKSISDAISRLSDGELKQHFGHYYRQLAGEYDGDITQPHPNPVPAGEAYNEYREYKLDIYLTDDGDIDATSGVHTMYYAGYNDPTILKSTDPYPDRDPDGRLEHVVVDIEWDQFDTFLDYHLRCQIRDSYLSRGEEPPEEYRVVGPGTDHMMSRQMHLDAVPPYHEYGADIDGYRADDTFNAGPVASLLNLI
ncbi:hypothetical protein [Haloarcula onubensis]|uniref:Uncharacterized protein n=1 Tax=Haloarcula onubensis TaxID=2950539 RepID=A0ABU2FUP3_9EURY|nr:hypothetical protein [Halomicroarcula sp. S3CR25-11]MDS0283961.1 hypothetical protein [Halomicroarcula sp. S3CR25-11]